MLAVLINGGAVILGGLLGMLFGKVLKKNLTDAAMIGIGLCTVYIGISGSLKGENVLITIGAMVFGAMIGTRLDLDGAMTRLGHKAQLLTRNRFGQVAEAFVAAALLFCVGAMSVTGALEAGLRGDHATLMAKSALDFVAAIMLASTLGIGVVFAALAVVLYEGAIVLLAYLVAPVLTPSAVNEMSCAGSLVLLALGLNLLGITKIKVADLLPAIILAPVFTLLAGLFT